MEVLSSSVLLLCFPPSSSSSFFFPLSSFHLPPPSLVPLPSPSTQLHQPHQEKKIPILGESYLTTSHHLVLAQHEMRNSQVPIICCREQSPSSRPPLSLLSLTHVFPSCPWALDEHSTSLSFKLITAYMILILLIAQRQVSETSSWLMTGAFRLVVTSAGALSMILGLTRMMEASGLRAFKVFLTMPRLSIECMKVSWKLISPGAGNDENMKPVSGDARNYNDNDNVCHTYVLLCH